MSQKPFETIKNDTGLELIRYSPTFDGICSIGKQPIQFRVEIEYYPGEQLLEFISFEAWLRNLGRQEATIEQYAQVIFDTMVCATEECPLRMVLCAHTETHAPVQVVMQTPSWSARGAASAYFYRIAKQFTFSASHALSHLSAAHPCHNLHGHNYVVAVELSGGLNEYGMVLDYHELQPFKEYLDGTLDHRHLNDVLPFPSTAENLARHLFEWCKERWSQTSAVRVSETPKTWAEYRE